MYIYLCSPTLSQIFIEKFLWESDFSNFGQNRNDVNKNQLFGRYFETVQHFQFFFPELCFFFIVHTYMVQSSLQNSGGKVVFLGGSMEPPLGHQRE